MWFGCETRGESQRLTHRPLYGVILIARWRCVMVKALTEAGAVVLAAAILEAVMTTVTALMTLAALRWSDRAVACYARSRIWVPGEQMANPLRAAAV